jgi:lipopolysaccharide/colanic/teichoic acid biosynthesis glycosyltransferase
MVQNADQKGLKLTASGDARITRVGRWLRKAKLDEIPQLLNVLRGEMSLVGPRPEVPEYVATYNPEQREVLKLKPGITGPASLTFIDEEKYLAGQPSKEDFYLNVVVARKVALDLSYCQTVTFWGDVRLIFGTIAALLMATKKRGAASGHETQV